MRALKIVIRWLSLIAGIVMFALYLNSAAYRAWVAGGPPTPNPEGWLFSAWNAWSFACLSGGIGAFIAVGKLPALSKVGVAFLLLAVALWLFPFGREFVASDACLDGGGKWSAPELRCLHE